MNGHASELALLSRIYTCFGSVLPFRINFIRWINVGYFLFTLIIYGRVILSRFFFRSLFIYFVFWLFRIVTQTASHCDVVRCHTLISSYVVKSKNRLSRLIESGRFLQTKRRRRLCAQLCFLFVSCLSSLIERNPLCSFSVGSSKVRRVLSDVVFVRTRPDRASVWFYTDRVWPALQIGCYEPDVPNWVATKAFDWDSGEN